MRFILLQISLGLNKISRLVGLLSSYIYTKYCIESCSGCNGSGFELGYENNISDCKYCKGDGYTEVEW